MIKKICAIILGLATLVAAIIATVDYFERKPIIDIAGEWRIENTVDETTYRAFLNMTLGYKMYFRQQGNLISGTGEKISENGKSIPSSAHSPVSFAGTLDGRDLSLTYEEKGAKRTTTGIYVWTFSKDGRSLKGTFSGTAANSKGRSTGWRVN